MRLLPYLRLKQSKIRPRFDFWFKRRISHVPNLMHELKKIIMIHLLPTMRPNFRECHARKSQNNTKKWRETKGFVVLALQRQNILVWRAVISFVWGARCSKTTRTLPGRKQQNLLHIASRVSMKWWNVNRVKVSWRKAKTTKLLAKMMLLQESPLRRLIVLRKIQKGIY